MRLTKADIAVLQQMGVPERDIPQIREAAKGKTTRYKLNNHAIDGKTVYLILGRNRFLAGLSRSAFHQTAVQETDNGGEILFDSSALFKNR